MPTMLFTDRSLRALGAMETSEYRDKKLPGFGIRVTPKGRKAFFVRYRIKGRTQQERMPLGLYPDTKLADARAAARAALGAASMGHDPKAEVGTPDDVTVAELATAWIEHHAKRKRASWASDQQLVNRDIIPAIGRLKARALRRREVLEMLESIVDRGAKTLANRVKETLSSIYTWGVLWEYVSSNPLHKMPLPAERSTRSRVLTPDEIRAVWNAPLHPVTRACLRGILLTAQRPGEVAGMACGELSPPWWNIPKERMKKRKAHRAYLSPPMLTVIAEMEEWRRSEGVPPCEYVFASPQRSHRPILEHALSSAVRKYRDKHPALFPGGRWTPHDLRRTATTLMAEIGVTRFVIRQVLSHVEPGVTGVYDRHTYDPEKVEAISALGRRVMEIVNSQPDPLAGGG